MLLALQTQIMMKIFRLLDQIIRIFSDVMDTRTLDGVMSIPITGQTFLDVLPPILNHKLFQS